MKERETVTIDNTGGPFTLGLLDMVLANLSDGNDVLIKNCTGGNMLTLGMYLMAMYEKARAGKVI